MVSMNTKLSQKEKTALVSLLNRATKHEQVAVQVNIGNKGWGHTPKGCIMECDGLIEIHLSFDALAFLWRRACGAKGGKKKAETTAKKKRHTQNPAVEHRPTGQG